METYKLEISAKNLLEMLSQYFTLKLDKPIKVKERHEVFYTGYYEEETTKVIIYFEEEVEILGHKATKKTELNKEDIQIILDGMLADQGYYIETMNYVIDKDNGYSHRGEPYTSTFDGVSLTLAEIQKKLQKKV